MSRNKREGKFILGAVNKHDVACCKMWISGKLPKKSTRYGNYNPKWRNLL